jgi:hypothetical protein
MMHDAKMYDESMSTCYLKRIVSHWVEELGEKQEPEMRTVARTWDAHSRQNLRCAQSLELRSAQSREGSQRTSHKMRVAMHDVKVTTARRTRCALQCTPYKLRDEICPRFQKQGSIPIGNDNSGAIAIAENKGMSAGCVRHIQARIHWTCSSSLDSRRYWIVCDCS